eukprot:gene10578-14209_t
MSSKPSTDDLYLEDKILLFWENVEKSWLRKINVEDTKDIWNLCNETINLQESINYALDNDNNKELISNHCLEALRCSSIIPPPSIIVPQNDSLMRIITKSGGYDEFTHDKIKSLKGFFDLTGDLKSRKGKLSIISSSNPTKNNNHNTDTSNLNVSEIKDRQEVMRKSLDMLCHIIGNNDMSRRASSSNSLESLHDEMLHGMKIHQQILSNISYKYEKSNSHTINDNNNIDETDTGRSDRVPPMLGKRGRYWYEVDKEFEFVDNKLNASSDTFNNNINNQKISRRISTSKFHSYTAIDEWSCIFNSNYRENFDGYYRDTLIHNLRRIKPKKVKTIDSIFESFDRSVYHKIIPPSVPVACIHPASWTIDQPLWNKGNEFTHPASRQYKYASPIRINLLPDNFKTNLKPNNIDNNNEIYDHNNLTTDIIRKSNSVNNNSTESNNTDENQFNNKNIQYILNEDFDELNIAHDATRRQLAYQNLQTLDKLYELCYISIMSTSVDLLHDYRKKLEIQNYSSFTKNLSIENAYLNKLLINSTNVVDKESITVINSPSLKLGQTTSQDENPALSPFIQQPRYKTRCSNGVVIKPSYEAEFEYTSNYPKKPVLSSTKSNEIVHQPKIEKSSIFTCDLIGQNLNQLPIMKFDEFRNSLQVGQYVELWMENKNKYIIAKIIAVQRDEIFTRHVKIIAVDDLMGSSPSLQSTCQIIVGKWIPVESITISSIGTHLMTNDLTSKYIDYNNKIVLKQSNNNMSYNNNKNGNNQNIYFKNYRLLLQNKFSSQESTSNPRKSLTKIESSSQSNNMFYRNNSGDKEDDEMDVYTEFGDESKDNNNNVILGYDPVDNNDYDQQIDSSSNNVRIHDNNTPVGHSTLSKLTLHSEHARCNSKVINKQNSFFDGNKNEIYSTLLSLIPDSIKNILPTPFNSLAHDNETVMMEELVASDLKNGMKRKIIEANGDCDIHHSFESLGQSILNHEQKKIDINNNNDPHNSQEDYDMNNNNETDNFVPTRLKRYKNNNNTDNITSRRSSQRLHRNSK